MKTGMKTAMTRTIRAMRLAAVLLGVVAATSHIAAQAAEAGKPARLLVVTVTTGICTEVPPSSVMASPGATAGSVALSVCVARKAPPPPRVLRPTPQAQAGGPGREASAEAAPRTAVCGQPRPA